jgi:hypothetical protein
VAKSSQGVNFAPVTGGGFCICGERQALLCQARELCAKGGVNLMIAGAFY